MSPLKINIRDKKFLIIEWDDNSASTIKLVNLRQRCPCAICNEERKKHGPDYIPILNDDEVTIRKIKIAGNYAVNIEWKDGHNTGLYTFEMLRGMEG